MSHLVGTVSSQYGWLLYQEVQWIVFGVEKHLEEWDPIFHGSTHGK